MMTRRFGMFILAGMLLVVPTSQGKWQVWSEIKDPGLLNIQPHPAVPGMWFGVAQDDGHGIYRSMDNALTWERIPHNLPGIKFKPDSLCVDPASPGRLFVAGTKVPHGFYDIFIFRSNDNGMTWQPMTVQPTFDDFGSCYRPSFRWMKITPAGSVLFVSIEIAVICSSNRVELWRSEDMGINFYEKLHSLAYGDHNLVFDELRPERIISIDSSSRVYQSFDYGLRWRKIYPPGSVNAIAPSPVNSDILYCFSDDDLGYNDLWKSPDRGETWLIITTILSDYFSGWNSSCLISDSNSGMMYLSHYSDRNAVPILRSPDGGETWYPFIEGYNEEYEFAATAGGRIIPDPVNPGNPFVLCGCKLLRWDGVNQQPFIPLAGYDKAVVDAQTGDTVHLQARVMDPDGYDDVDYVELWYEGMPTGVRLTDSGRNGDFVANDGVYTLTIVLPGNHQVPAGQYLLEIVAVDHQGAASTVWPYCKVNGSGGNREPTSDLLAQMDFSRALMNDQTCLDHCIRYTPSLPPQFSNKLMIPFAGWTFTDLCPETINGVLNLTALITASEGLESINAVELFAGGAPTGYLLERSESFMPYSALENAYGLGFKVGTGLSPGLFLAEISAGDIYGNRSGLWPYLTVK